MSIPIALFLLLLVSSSPPRLVTAADAYITYHNYYDGQSTGEISCSDGANGLQQKFGYYTIDPMSPYVSATSNIVWNSPNCATCYKLYAASTGNTVYVSAIDQCGTGPSGEFHFDMHPTAFTELLGSAGTASGSGYAEYEAVDSSYCKGNTGHTGDSSGGGDGGGGEDGGLNCFSGSSQVQVRGQGSTAMSNLRVGDWIVTSVKNQKSTYHLVYGLAHHNREGTAEFLEIHHTNTSLPPLQVTWEHLIHVNGQFVPANTIRVGDTLLHCNDDECWPVVVNKIKKSTQTGLYAPLTTSGTLLVNGITASSYVTLPQYSVLDYLERINGWMGWVPSEHAFLHGLLSPIRLLCLGISSKFCMVEGVNSETQSGAGYAWYVKLAFWLMDVFTRAHPFVQTALLALYVIVCGSCGCVEFLVFGQGSSTFVGFVVVLGATAAQWRQWMVRTQKFTSN